VLAFALIGLLAVPSVPAYAKLSHLLLSSFGGGETPGGAFGVITGVAVDDSSGAGKGDVYVDELSLATHTGAVDKFEANGKYAGVQITGAETPQGFFSPIRALGSGELAGVAVDSTSGANSGDVYVVDVRHDIVDRFSESGHYICQITGTITPSPSECNGAGGSATPNGSFEPTGVAVDSTGNVYVSDRVHDVIDQFGPAGAYVSQISGANITTPGALELGSTGDLYLLNFKSNVVELEPSGSFVAAFDESEASIKVEPTAMASDRSSGHVYAVNSAPQSQIAEFDGTGTFLDTFGAGLFKKALGLAVSGSTGNVYLAEELTVPGAKVYVFGPDVVLPSVTTNPATGVDQTTATFNGAVDPDKNEGGGDIVSCQFEYGTSTSYGQVVPCSPSTPYSAATGVSAGVSSLTPSTTYHFRLDARNAEGSERGADQTFITPGPPSVSSESSSNAVTTSADVQAQINPFGLDTTCHVQYVDEEDFKSSAYANATTLPCVPEDLGSAFGDRSAVATLTGLHNDTVYHYRFLATNAAAPSGSAGADQTFATFGIESFSIKALERGGQGDLQAGSHPYALTTSFVLNTTTVAGPNFEPKSPATDANPRDVRVELPPGLIGDPQATPRCLPYDIAHANCSGAAQVGMLKVLTTNGQSTESPIYNMVPPTGMAAQFGARFNGFVTAHIDAKIRTGGDYGVTADSFYLSAAEGLTGATVTLWGVPAELSHDSERYCPVAGKINEEPPCSERSAPVPFLTNPTSCTGPQMNSLQVDSWQEPGVFVTADATTPGMTGCAKLDLSPTITVLPEGQSGDASTGLQVHLHVPQNGDSGGLAEANLRTSTITLPVGMTVNPSGADGLVGCSEAQIELKGPEPAKCPDASKIGTVEIDTPLLDHPLKGGVYAAQQGNGGPAQGSNPFGSLLALYIAVDDPQTGVVVKLAGKVTVDPLTGQISTTFAENPQLPFEDLRLELFGGPRASLATPMACGTYTTTTSLTPWSAPESGPPASPSFPFQITSGPGQTPCAPPSFTPSFVAGTSNDDADAFTPFVMNLTRKDGEQRLSTIALTMPPGVAGVVPAVTLCPEAQANAGDCPASSRIGHVRVSAGVGNEPIVIPEAGKPEDPVYLTGPYEGAPFGLSVVVPAQAGPFNLDEGGHPVVVRARIQVDPYTAQVSVFSDPMPTRLQGIPLDVRSIEAVVDKPGFIFNPTSCDPMSVTGAIGSSEGASENVSSRYQAASCASLPFRPSFSVATSAKHTRNDGDGLRVVVGSTPGQANIAAVHVELPKVLPSRLSTLKLACPEAVFAANPAACPPGSRIGTEIAYTPILSVPLTGPAYFVSHGGAKFPELILVLQGEGVTVQLAGETFISGKGITSSTFGHVPDVPVSRFELNLPAGPDSVLGANGDLCASKLIMPTTITAQNGTILKLSTRISVGGCKPAIRVLRHSVRRDTATIVASVPSTGVLIASGAGLSRVKRKLRRAGPVTLELTLNGSERSLLAHHPGRQLKAEIELHFTPTHGHPLSSRVSVLIG
jgi:hypothetical protein